MDRSRGIGRIVRGWAILAMGTLGASGCESGTEPTLAVRLKAVTPTALTGTVGQVVTPVPTVLVTDEGGAPLAGVVVSFFPDESSGSVQFRRDTTSEDGTASVGRWRLPLRAGPVALQARAGDKTVDFRATAEAGLPQRISPASGQDQLADAGATLPVPLGVWVADASWNSVAGAEVRFAVLSGGGGVTESSTYTDESGHTETFWTLGPSVGAQEVRVEVAGGDEDVLTLFSAFARCGEGGDPCGTAVPPPGRIAFVSERDGDAEIYTINADGSDLKRLTNHSGADLSPAWSPDGTHIAFSSERSGTSQIYTMKADGSEVVQRTQGGPAHEPAWSPDGAQIVYVNSVFVSDEESEEDLWVVALGGGGPGRLLARPGWQGHPSWSPDGTRIAFVDGHVFGGIYLVNADGSEPRSFADYLAAPSWSPDGQRLSVTMYSPRRIAVMAPDGSGRVALAPSSHSTRGSFPQGYTGSSWSPDGTRIAFIWAGDPPRIAWIKADGGGAGIIVEDGHSPSWGP